MGNRFKALNYKDVVTVTAKEINICCPSQCFNQAIFFQGHT